MSEPISRSRLEEVWERSRCLMELGVQSGARLFVPEESLLRQKHPTHPHYTGYVVAQTPLEYAIALLETGGDAERANRIIRRTTDFQDRDPASPTYGNFIWMTHWQKVNDRNAVSFMTPNYAWLWRRHRAKLDAQTRACLASVFPLALRGIRAHRVPPRYTNIFLLNLLTKLELALILGDEGAGREARADWETWVAEVSRHGIAEYNSPCYTSVDLYALEGILEAAPAGEFRRQVKVLLEHVWTEFAVNYHSSIKCLTGPMSRAYPADYLYGNGLAGVIAFQQFGTRFATFDSNGGLTPFVVNYAMRHYVVPESVLEIALNKTWPVTVRGYLPEQRIAWTNYLTRDFALGSQTGYYCSQEMPVFLAFRTRRKRRSLFFKSEPPTPVLASAQDQGLLLGGFRHPKATDQPNSQHRARASPSIRLHLGPAKALRQRRLQFCDSGTARTRKRSCLFVAVRLDSVWVGVKAFLAGPALGETAVALDRRGTEPSIVWRMGKSLSRAGSSASPVVGFVLFVAGLKQHASLNDFARHVEGYAVTVTPRADGVALAVEGHGAHLDLEVPPAELPSAEHLHASPYLLLRPGDLEEHVVRARQSPQLD